MLGLRYFAVNTFIFSSMYFYYFCSLVCKLIRPSLVKHLKPTVPLTGPGFIQHV